MFNPAVASLETPAIPLALSWIEDYQQQYGSPIDLSQAVPSYPPPPAVLHSLAAHAGSSHSTGYGQIEGEPLLREHYADHINRIYSAGIAAANVHITSGCNQAFVAALIALARAGDRIVMSNPCYFNHEASARMLDLQVKYLDCDEQHGFAPTMQAIQACVDRKTRVLALVSPNNPTGAVYSASLLREIYAHCRQTATWLIVDETYRDFLPAQTIPHPLLSEPDWQQTFIQLYSFSKSLCIPGHRLGTLLAGTEVISNVAKVMDNLQICAPRAAQLCVAEQLPKLDDWRVANQREIQSRATVFAEVLQGFPQWKIASLGAYFAYVRHPFAESSLDVARRLAQQYGVLGLPGSFFGARQQQYLRLAFANADISTLRQLGDRLSAIADSPDLL